MVAEECCYTDWAMRMFTYGKHRDILSIDLLERDDEVLNTG